jgi:DNA-binding transcriptional regulator YiaG
MKRKDEVREIRKRLGWSQARLAAALRLGKGGDRIVRGWESGEHEPGGPVLVALAYILRDATRLRRPFG